MIIKEINDKKQWDEFLIANKGDFLQSWQWGEFQEKLGRKIFRLAVEENGQIAVLLIVKYELPFGKNYLYSGRGPVINIKYQKLNIKNLIELLEEKIQEIAKKESCIFFRIDPNFYFGDQEAENIFKETGFVNSGFYSSSVGQPNLVWQLDIALDEEKIFSNMKEKTRYNIRLAERKGVKIRESKDLKDLEKFYILARETAKRDNFQLHSKEHYLKLFKILIENNLGSLFLAEHEDDVLSAIIVLFFNQKAIFLHGASSGNKRNLMANQLTQWGAIKQAKKRECLVYDFGGIAPEDSLNHPWQGVTRFKKSFGGKEINYLPACDLVFQRFWHILYKLAKRVRYFL